MTGRNGVVEGIRQAMMRLGRQLHRHPLPGGLTPPQYLVLRMLACCSMRPSDVADALSVTPGTVTPLIDRLIDAGLVARARDAHDRRVLRLSLTRQGRRRLDQIERRHRQTWERLLSSLSDHEVQTLHTLLAKVLTCLEDPDRAPGPPREREGEEVGT